MATVASATPEFSGNSLIQKRLLEIKELEKERERLRDDLTQRPVRWGGAWLLGGTALIGVMTGGLGLAITGPVVADVLVKSVGSGAQSVLAHQAEMKEIDQQITLKYSALIRDFNNQYSQGNLSDKEAMKYYFSLGLDSFQGQFGNDLVQLKNNLGV